MNISATADEFAFPTEIEGQPLAGKNVLIVVENLPLPFDRRVWQEARTLKAAGAAVAVICPTGKGYEKRHEVIEGVEIYRHPLPLEASGALGFLLEYGAALFWETVLSWKIYLKRGWMARWASPLAEPCPSAIPSRPSSPITPPHSVLSRSRTRHLRASPLAAASTRQT
nr:glycosyltransferase [Novosphingobium sp. PC22D]